MVDRFGPDVFDQPPTHTTATVTDLWTGGSLGTVTGTLSQSLPAHGSALLRLVPV